MEIERNVANHLRNLQPPAGGGSGGDPDPPPPPHLKCPRCDSYNTKFCYYNNYSKAQPRYYCRACRRHWTHGGTLRNVPIGGNRRNRLPPAAAAAPQGQAAMPQAPEIPAPPPPPPMMVNGSYAGGNFLQPFPPPQFGTNLSLLQAMTFQSMRSPAAENLFPPQPNLINRPIGPWAPNMNAAGPSFTGEGPSFLDEAGPSFGAPNQWEEDDHQG